MTPGTRAARDEPYMRLPADRRLELGCGSRKLHTEAVGVDALPLDGVDIVGRVPGVLDRFADASFDVIYSSHFLEHVDDVGLVMDEAARLLRTGGRFIAVVPHFSNPYFYSDPTHRSPFGLYTMSYFAVDRLHRRQVPNYVANDREVRFRIIECQLRFNRSLRRPLTYLVGRLLEFGCRRSRRFREFYEARLAWLAPCDEIRFELETI